MNDQFVITPRAKNLIIALLAAIFIGHSVYTLVRETAWIGRVWPGFWILKCGSVPGAFFKDMAGYERGVKYADTVIGVNDRVFNDGEELLDFVSRQKPGAELGYLLQNRQGVRRTVSVPAQQMTTRDYFQYFVFPKINGMAFFLLGLAVFYLKPNTRISRIFLLCGVIMGFIFESLTDYRVNEFNLMVYCLPLLAPTMLLIGLDFPVEVKRRKAVIFIVLLFTIPVEILYGYSLKSAPFYHIVSNLVLANNAVWGTVGILIMVRSFVRSTDISVRKRGKIGVYGFLLTFICASGAQLGDYVWGGATIYSFYLFRISLMILPATLAYAIVVHNIFDVDQFIRQSLIYLLVSGIIVTIFIVMVLALSMALQDVTGRSSQIATILSTVVMMILFRPLRDRIEQGVARRFNREKYEYQTTIREASEALATIIELRELLNHILNTVMNAIKITRGTILLRDKDSGTLEIAVAKGYENPSGIEAITGDNPLITHLEIFGRGLQLNDIETFDAFRSNREPTLELMRRLQIVLAIPILYERRLIGLLGLGEKMNGAWYSTEDIALLRSLMIQTAVSIENARKVEDLKKMVELETSYRDLKRLDEMKDNFLSMVSHDLRTPMTSIKGYASILMDKIDKYDKDRQVKYLSIIVKESDRLTRLINDLLDLQRFEAGKMQMLTEDVNLSELVRTSADSFNGAALGKNISLQTRGLNPLAEGVAGGEFIVKGDRDRLSQVVANLMSNAIKFTPEGGWVGVSMEKYDEKGAPFIKVSVSDNGPGIPKDKQGELFNKFQQVEGAVRNKEQGSGLGLALVREIVERHGGRVGVESEPGKGSVFYFVIPAA